MVAASSLKLAPLLMKQGTLLTKILVTPELRTAALRATDAEWQAAAQMSDELFWNYDQAWLGLGAPSLINARRPGAAGGGGRNTTWNNNQFWSLAQECDRGLFTLVMYQQRRYMAAQQRLARHLRAVPQPEILQGFDQMPTVGNVRQACSGVEVKARAQDWAYWCEEAIRLIGAARWASNFSWSDTSQTCGDFTYRVDAQPIVGKYDLGCRYIPDCATDPYGVARIGYVAGSAPDGILRWEAITSGYKNPRAVASWLAAAERWQLSWRPANDAEAVRRQGGGTPLGFGADWPISISPRVLGLHHRPQADGPPAQIPTDSQAFNGMWAKYGPGAWPTFLQAPNTTELGVGDWLYAYFLEQPSSESAYLAQKTLRDQTGCYFWKYAPGSGDGIATGIAYAVPGPELMIWRLIAHARDIVAKPFGQVVVDGFTNLDRAVQGIPVQFRGTLEERAAQVHAAAAAVRAEQAAVVGGAFAAMSGAAAAINPIAGLLVGLLGSLSTALVAFSIDIGLARGSNPPALQAPALRVAPTTITGDDRCWINPGELESLSAYQVRVTAPYAEAAQRTGGDPGAVFDLIPTVRADQFCRANPGHPNCVAPQESSSWTKWLLGAGGTAAGVALIKVLGG